MVIFMSVYTIPLLYVFNCYKHIWEWCNLGLKTKLDETWQWKALHYASEIKPCGCPLISLDIRVAWLKHNGHNDHAMWPLISAASNYFMVSLLGIVMEKTRFMAHGLLTTLTLRQFVMEKTRFMAHGLLTTLTLRQFSLSLLRNMAPGG